MVTVFEREKSADFVLVDESGSALVQMRETENVLLLRGRYTQVKSYRSEGSPDVARWLESQGQPYLQRTLILHEEVLEAGAQVTAVGVASWRPDPAQSPKPTRYREVEWKHHLVMEAPETSQLIISDVP